MDARSLGALAPRMLLTLASLALACAGCKTAPKNPFAEQPPVGQAEGAATPTAESAPPVAATADPGGMTAVEAESGQLRRLGAGVALAAVGLGQEVTQAAKGAAARVKLAAASTLDLEKRQAQQIAAYGVDTAGHIAARRWRRSAPAGNRRAGRGPKRRCGPSGSPPRSSPHRRPQACSRRNP